MNIFSNIEDSTLENLYNSTKTRGIISTLKNNSKEADQVTKLVYTLVAKQKTKLSKSFDKCLIIENHFAELTEKQLALIQESILEKKEYKYNLLDYLKYILDNSESSNEMHQEIGLYLGMDRHKLGKIYKTRKGDRVRSKSELIIANLLFSENIKYEYEQKLFYKKGKWIEPDFTINIKGEDYYWERLGMIGTENYDNRWLEKIEIFNKYYPDKLINTYESAVLTDSAMDVINELKST